MKNYLLSTLLIIISATSFGQTYISGIINSNATWTVASSPYIVTSNTVLMPGFTITVDPGVTVKFDANVELDVRGTLLCNGTILDTIYFIPLGSTRWYGIRVSNNYGARIDFRFVKATYSSTLFGVAISGGAPDTILKVVNCIFDNVGTVIDEADAMKTHYVFIDSCIISNNAGYCCAGASNTFAYNSKFINNYRVFYNSTSQYTTINNCDFIGNTDCALLIVGIVTNSRFFNNQRAISTMSNNYPILHNNDIYSNYIGIEAWNSGSANSITQITNNRICNNIYNIKKIYSSDTYVINNCWCLTDSTQIESTIYDFFDDSGLGIVYFSPYDTTCLNIFSGTNQPFGQYELNLSPNPFTENLNIALINNKVSEIVLYDIAARKLIQQKFTNSISISTSQLANGIYIYELRSNGHTIKKGKVVKNE